MDNHLEQQGARYGKFTGFVGFRDNCPIMKNQLEEKMEHDMEFGLHDGLQVYSAGFEGVAKILQAVMVFRVSGCEGGNEGRGKKLRTAICSGGFSGICRSIAPLCIPF